MGELLNLVTPIHESTARDYLQRANDEKVRCMAKAREYDYHYWDGDRRFGYGGYSYIPGLWQPVAQGLIDRYGLNEDSSVLDVGCGKGYLLYEIKLLLPDIHIVGFDISKYGITNSKKEIREQLFNQPAEEVYPYEDDSFDLVISIGCLHNLRIQELETALGEIQRVSKRAYTLVESYRSISEFFNLQCWALTANSLFDVDEWMWIYSKFGYSGDYEFIYFT